MGFRLHFPAKNITPPQIHTYYVHTHSPLIEEGSSGKCKRRLGGPKSTPSGWEGYIRVLSVGMLRTMHLR